MPALHDTFLLSQGAVFRDLDGESVILDLDSGTYFGLNQVGTRIWQLLERDGRIETVFEALRKEFDVEPERLAGDLLELVARLADAGLGEVKQPSEP